MSQLLQNETLKLRALEPEDLELLYNWENNSSIWEHSNTLKPYSKFVLRNYLENAHKDIFEVKQVRFIIEIITTKLAIGTIDLFDIDFYNSRAGVGILIANEKQRNKGYAGESLELITNYAFQHLGLYQLYCNINEDNKNSLKLFQKSGFKITGKKENWVKKGLSMKNVYFLQLLSQTE
ncbi:MAG: GNAT family N-acetyltransferase [Bacteroidetes bacterium]|nr:MAG: GNAT family N-acetyltransferase [Bacteroidota bacterium]